MTKYFSVFAGLLCMAFQANSGANTLFHYSSNDSLLVKSDFYTYFADRTMRIDYRHSGDDKTESFEMAKIASEGSWAGRTNHLNDPWKLGLYFFEVKDAASGNTIYSQGFCSVFGEWQTTAEAKAGVKTFNETIRLPWPKNEVNVVLQKRDSLNRLVPVWNLTVNPVEYEDLIPTRPSAFEPKVLLDNGDPKFKADIVILGDGYAENEDSLFWKDAQRFSDAFFSVEPFKSRIADFNVRAVLGKSTQSGIRLQRKDFYPDNLLKTSYYAFGIERYVLASDDWIVKDYASIVPYDFIVILMNSDKYGGGGIFNLYITAAAHSRASEYVMVHEMGHHIAGLADEYYTSDVAYEPANTKVEPWEFNITALINSDSLKWRDLVAPGTPIPTPWNKVEYEQGGGNKVLLSDPAAGKVGAYEGANYLSKGMFRPEVNCIMIAGKEFCQVCKRGINRVLDLYCE